MFALNSLHVQTLMSTDAQTPFLETPLVPLRPLVSSIHLDSKFKAWALWRDVFKALSRARGLSRALAYPPSYKSVSTFFQPSAPDEGRAKKKNKYRLPLCDRAYEYRYPDVTVHVSRGCFLVTRTGTTRHATISLALRQHLYPQFSSSATCTRDSCARTFW